MNSIEEVLAHIDALEISRPYLSANYAVTAAQVAEAEASFGHSFPRSYRDFLLTLGSGDFGGVEFYGLVPSGNSVEEATNALWFTRSMQEEMRLPQGLFIIEDLGDGALACLDLRGMDAEECPVVLWDPSESSSRSYNVLAKTYGEYFKSRVLSVL